MVYRCLLCDHEEGRGCLPTASCGLYLFSLPALAAGILWGAAYLLRRAIVPRPEAAPRPPAPWWVWPVAAVVTVVAIAGTTVALKWGLEAAERLAVLRRPCPRCGGRRWSRGFTRGYGL
jgi:hypothetical protein